MTDFGSVPAFTVKVNIDAQDFKDFAIFDVFIRLRRWVPMAAFAAILSVSAIICFLMRNRAERAVLLGVVLLVVAIGVPLVYLRQFYQSVSGQAKRMGLSEGAYVYTIELSDAPNGVMVEAVNGTQAQFNWEEIYAAYRRQKAIYLYTEKTKAYLLPNMCVPGNPDDLWRFLQKQLPEGKCMNRR